MAKPIKALSVAERKHRQGYLNSARSPKCINCTSCDDTNQVHGYSKTFCTHGQFVVTASGWCPHHAFKSTNQEVGHV